MILKINSLLLLLTLSSFTIAQNVWRTDFAGGMHFEEHEAAADGNCGFHALGISRQQTLNLLLENAADANVRNLLQPLFVDLNLSFAIDDEHRFAEAIELYLSNENNWLRAEIIDAIAYLNNMTVHIFIPDRHDALQLNHVQTASGGNNRVIYVVLSNNHYNLLSEIDEVDFTQSQADINSFTKQSINKPSTTDTAMLTALISILGISSNNKLPNWRSSMLPVVIAEGARQLFKQTISEKSKEEAESDNNTSDFADEEANFVQLYDGERTPQCLLGRRLNSLAEIFETPENVCVAIYLDRANSALVIAANQNISTTIAPFISSLKSHFPRFISLIQQIVPDAQQIYEAYLMGQMPAQDLDRLINFLFQNEELLNLFVDMMPPTSSYKSREKSLLKRKFYQLVKLALYEMQTGLVSSMIHFTPILLQPVFCESENICQHAEVQIMKHLMEKFHIQNADDWNSIDIQDKIVGISKLRCRDCWHQTGPICGSPTSDISYTPRCISPTGKIIKSTFSSSDILKRNGRTKESVAITPKRKFTGLSPTRRLKPGKKIKTSHIRKLNNRLNNLIGQLDEEIQSDTATSLSSKKNTAGKKLKKNKAKTPKQGKKNKKSKKSKK